MRRSAILLLLVLTAGCGQAERRETPPSPPRGEAAGCKPVSGQDGLYAGGRAESCTVSGGRRYLLFRPAGAPDGAPLLIGIHGVGGGGATPEFLVESARLDRLAAGLGAVLAVPEAVDGSWNEAGEADAPDDVAFVAALMDDAAGRADAAGTGALVVGWSGGGYMVHRLGCELSRRVAAIAALQAPLRGRCRPERPLSVLQIAGTADDVIPYRGGSDPLGDGTPGVEAATARWRRLLGCPAPERRRSGRVLTIGARGCDGGTAVDLVALRGGGHAWYGAQEPPPDDSLDASTVVRRFFAAATSGG